MKNLFYILGIVLMTAGCFSRPQPTGAPAFPELNIADSIAVSAKWHTLATYDRKQTTALRRHFAPPAGGLDDTTNCFAQATGHFRLHKQDYYIVDWSDSLFTWGAETRLYVFVADSNTYRFVQTLAFSYGSEGSDIETASWFFDSDGDRIPELFTRSYAYYVTGDTSHCSDDITAWRIEKTGLKPQPVADPMQLKKKLHFKNAMLCETE